MLDKQIVNWTELRWVDVVFIIRYRHRLRFRHLPYRIPFPSSIRRVVIEYAQWLCQRHSSTNERQDFGRPFQLQWPVVCMQQQLKWNTKKKCCWSVFLHELLMKIVPSLDKSLEIRIFSVAFSDDVVDSAFFGVSIASVWIDCTVNWLFSVDNGGPFSRGAKILSKWKEIYVPN